MQVSDSAPATRSRPDRVEIEQINASSLLPKPMPTAICLHTPSAIHRPWRLTHSSVCCNLCSLCCLQSTAHSSMFWIWFVSLHHMQQNTCSRLTTWTTCLYMYTGKASSYEFTVLPFWLCSATHTRACLLVAFAVLCRLSRAHVSILTASGSGLATTTT